MSERGRQIPIFITGVWSRRIGLNVETLLEINGRWVKVSSEPFDGYFSHIVEPNGIRQRCASEESIDLV